MTRLTKAEREELARFEAAVRAEQERLDGLLRGRGTNWGVQKSKKYIAALEVARSRFTEQTIQGYLETGGVYGLYHLLASHSWIWLPSAVEWMKPTAQVSHAFVGAAS